MPLTDKKLKANAIPKAFSVVQSSLSSFGEMPPKVKDPSGEG
jgi:hypothetical protein